MVEPFLGEIRITSFAFPPKGWSLCNGQLLSIQQNIALFSLLGTAYGGNGITTFALPDLQGRTPIHEGNGYTIGERGGEQGHTLTQIGLPAHTHTFSVSQAPANTNNPNNAMIGRRQEALYAPVSGNRLVASAPGMIGNVGGSQAHLNMQPFLTLSFIIAMQGIYPSQS